MSDQARVKHLVALITAHGTELAQLVGPDIARGALLGVVVGSFGFDRSKTTDLEISNAISAWAHQNTTMLRDQGALTAARAASHALGPAGEA